MTSPIPPGSTGLLDTQDAELIAEVTQKASPFAELGVTGLKRAGGYIDEEFLPQLKGRKSVQVYREMNDNDAIIGAVIFAITQLIRNVDWRVIPGGKGAEDNQAAKLVETAKDDMSHPWEDFIGEALTCLPFGWSWHEIVYKRRGGPWERNPKLKSKYSDGLVGWRKLPLRSQDTLLRWVFDDTGGVQGMIQLGPPDYQTRPLPIERSLLFRFGPHKGNPEGRSLLRNAYRSWYFKKRFEEFEAIGVERDLAGLPMVKVPSSYLKAKPGTDQAKMIDAFRKMIRSIRRDEQEGVIFPTAFDAETKQPLFDFELLGSGGARQFSTDTIIQRLEQRMLMTVLADFIMVGHTQTGTYNMHLDKTGMFKAALNSVTKMIADVMNRHAIPRLFLANGWKPANLPQLVADDVDSPDLTQLAQFLGATSQLGFTWGPDADLEKWLRSAAGMPQLGEDDYAKHRQFARRAESTRFAQAEIEYLAARSELAQAVAREQMMMNGEPTPEEAQMIGAQQMQGQQAQQQGEAHQMQMTTGRLDQMQRFAQMIGGGGNGPGGGGASGGGASGGGRPAGGSAARQRR